MPVVDIKQKLHKAIDAIDDEQYLQALADILLDVKSGDKPVLSEAGLTILKEREANYNNSGKGLPLDDFTTKMKTKYGL